VPYGTLDTVRTEANDERVLQFSKLPSLPSITNWLKRRT
jgi:hypothetical protein